MSRSSGNLTADSLAGPWHGGGTSLAGIVAPSSGLRSRSTASRRFAWRSCAFPTGCTCRIGRPTSQVRRLRTQTDVSRRSPSSRSQMLQLTGLALDGGRAHGDGPGDHARSCASFLTGAHPKKTHGADIKNGVSVDQVAAGTDRRQDAFPISGTRHRARFAVGQLRLGV